MHRLADRAWLVAGALAGGLLTGGFGLQPAWAWGMAAGAAGGALGLGAAWTCRQKWSAPLRILAVALLLGGGFFLLWLLAGRQWLLEETRRSLGA